MLKFRLCYMKNLFFVFFLIMSLHGKAQCVLSFNKPTVEGNKFRVTLQMSSGIPFSLGPNNLRFNYSTENLDNPVIISDNFPNDAFGETTLLGSNRQTGIVSVNTAYHGKTGAEGLPITKNGTELVTLEFDIVKFSEKIHLNWRLDKLPRTALVTDDRIIISVSEAKPLITDLLRNTSEKKL